MGRAGRASSSRRELAHQVRRTACDHEVSIPYHRLVTELFVCGFQIVEALAPDASPAGHHERLEQMLQFIADVHAAGWACAAGRRLRRRPSTCRSATTAQIRAIMVTCFARQA